MMIKALLENVSRQALVKGSKPFKPTWIHHKNGHFSILTSFRGGILHGRVLPVGTYHFTETLNFNHPDWFDKLLGMRVS